MSRPSRRVYGVKLSTDGGNRWRTVAICLICEAGINKTETLLKRETEAGVRFCDWCGALNGADSDESGAAAAREPLASSIISLNGVPSAASFGSIGELLARSTILSGENQNIAAENLPTEAVMLEVAYSPVIPYPFGELESAVEAVKINDFSYRYEYQGQVYTVSDEQLKEMRARYLVAHNDRAKAYLRANNPKGSIWHEIGRM